MSYSAWWREVGSEEWNQIISSEPITWTQERESGQCPIYYQGRWSYTNTLYYPSQTSSAWILGPITEYSAEKIAIFSSPTRDYYRVRLFGQTSWEGGFYTPVGWGVSQSPLATQDNAPDDCGSCTTTFSTGLVITRPDCIEVTTTPPECPCCGEMLPGASRILNRLEGMTA